METKEKIINLFKALISNKTLFRRLLKLLILVAIVTCVVLFFAFRSCEISQDPQGKWIIKSQSNLKVEKQ